MLLEVSRHTEWGEKYNKLIPPHSQLIINYVQYVAQFKLTPPVDLFSLTGEFTL